MLRAEFILEHRKGCWSMTDLCEAFGISRKTGYALLARYKKFGEEALRDRSRAPHSHPNKTPEWIERRIVKERREHPTWGVKKILARLGKKEPGTSWPARSTAERILNSAGLVQRRKVRARPSRRQRPLPVAVKPNDLWCQDYKGWFRVGSGERCDPYTLTDAASRFALCTKALNRPPRHEDVKRCLTVAFKEHGLPDGILSDNGSPFGCTQSLAGLTRLGVWLLRLDVIPHFIEPGRPEQNAIHERYHSTLKLETADPPKPTIRAQQMAFHRFLSEFNFERPHEALDMATPGEVYEPSPRAFPSRLPEWTYPDEFLVRKVSCCGAIKWRGKVMRIGDGFAGELIGLEQVGDGVFRIFLGRLPLGHFHERSMKIIPLPI